MATEGMNSMSNWIDKNPEVITGLITGGLGAVGGYTMSGDDPNETEDETFKRRLKNALIVGGLAGGAGALGAYAYNNFSSAQPDTATDRALRKVRHGGLDVLGTGVGGYLGAVAGKKFSNSKLPGGYGADIQAMAKNLSLPANTHPDVILNKLKAEALSGANMDRLAKIVGGNAKTVEGQIELANKLRLFGIKAKDVAGIDPKTAAKFFKEMKSMKLWNGRKAPVVALASLGTIGGFLGSEWGQRKFID